MEMAINKGFSELSAVELQEVDAGEKKLAWAFGIVGVIGGACGGVVAGAGSVVPEIGGASAGFTAGFAAGRAY